MTAHEATQPDSVVDELLAVLAKDPFRDPFFDDVRAHRMSRAGLKFWALQASLVVREFTRFISAIHANCPNRDAQRLLAENLWEEHGEGRSDADHYVLIRRLAISLGATEAELDQAKPLTETADYIDHCLRITREGDFVESLAAISIAIEYFMPVFFKGLADALQTHYGLPPRDVEYLKVHVTEDVKHARRSIEVLRRSLDSQELRDKAKIAVQQTLLVKRKFAEAVYRGCLTASQSCS
jgi:pyrroloquinoline-quinone synthase